MDTGLFLLSWTPVLLLTVLAFFVTAALHRISMARLQQVVFQSLARSWPVFAAMVGAVGREGTILRYTIPLGIIACLLVGAVVWMAA